MHNQSQNQTSMQSQYHAALVSLPPRIPAGTPLVKSPRMCAARLSTNPAKYEEQPYAEETVDPASQGDATIDPEAFSLTPTGFARRVGDAYHMPAMLVRPAAPHNQVNAAASYC